MFEAIKESKISARDVAERYGLEVNPKGYAHCIFHQDSGRASMLLDKDDSRYHCFGCGKSGNVIDLVSEYCGIPIRDAAIKICEDYHIDYDKPEYTHKPKQIYKNRKTTKSKTEITKKEEEKAKQRKQDTQKAQVTKMQNECNKIKPLLDDINVCVQVKTDKKTGEIYIEPTENDTVIKSKELCKTAKDVIEACGDRFTKKYLRGENCCDYTVKDFISYEEARYVCKVRGYDETAQKIELLMHIKGKEIWNDPIKVPFERNTQFRIECGKDKDGSLYVYDSPNKKRQTFPDTVENRVKIHHMFNKWVEKSRANFELTQKQKYGSDYFIKKYGRQKT